MIGEFVMICPLDEENEGMSLASVLSKIWRTLKAIDHLKRSLNDKVEAYKLNY